MSVRCLAAWVASTSDSNEPAIPSSSSAKAGAIQTERKPSGSSGHREHGDDACSQNGGPESPATPTYETWAIEAVGRKMSGGPEVGLGLRNDGVMYTLDRESRHAVALTSFAADFPAKTSASPAAELDSQVAEADCSMSSPASQMSFYDPAGGGSLRTYPDSFPATVAEISPSFSRRWPTSGSMTSLGECWTHDSSESPSGGGVSSSLRDVLEDHVAERYFLSQRAAAGILRRAEKRGRELPGHLAAALEAVAGRRTLSE